MSAECTDMQCAARACLDVDGRLVGGEYWLTLLFKRGFQPCTCNAINATFYARFMQAMQDPTHASNLMQAIPRFNCSVHTHCIIVRRRTATQLCPLTTTLSNNNNNNICCCWSSMANTSQVPNWCNQHLRNICIETGPLDNYETPAYLETGVYWRPTFIRDPAFIISFTLSKTNVRATKHITSFCFLSWR